MECRLAAILAADVVGPFVRHWRPLFAHMIALTWGLHSAAITFAMVFEPEYPASIVTPWSRSPPMWGVALFYDRAAGRSARPSSL